MEKKKIYVLRADKMPFHYVAQSESGELLYSQFLEYALWFESKNEAKKWKKNKTDWVDDAYKWWEAYDNKKMQKNKRPKGE